MCRVSCTRVLECLVRSGRELEREDGHCVFVVVHLVDLSVFNPLIFSGRCDSLRQCSIDRVAYTRSEMSLVELLEDDE